jgi:hypothetical protein
MKLNPLLLAVLILAAAFLSACSTTYAPRAGAVDPKLIPNIPTGQRIALVNAQPSTERVLVGDAGLARKVYGNLHVWTDNALAGIRKSLEKKGAVVDANAGKSLKLAITKAHFAEAGAGWAFRATIDFTVETSDGQISKLTADDPSWKFLNACDGAMRKVPLVTLTNESVVKFLSMP